MATVVLAPFYVPRPPYFHPWQGGEPVGDVLIQNLTAVKFYGALGQAPTKRWEYDPDRPKVWVGTPLRAFSLYVPIPPPPIIPRLWRYDFDVNQFWSPVPRRKDFETVVPLNPFSNSSRREYFPDPYWLGTPIEALTAYIPPIPVRPKLWRYDYVPDPIWIGEPLVSFSSYVPPTPTRPRLWRYDNVPNPNWLGTPLPAFSAYLPVAGNPIIPRMWRWDHVPNPVWVWEAPPAWSNYIPQTNPFSKLWRYDYVPASVWTWSGTESAYLPVTNPFHKLWRSDYVPTPNWVWKAPRSYQIYMPTVVTFFGAQGQAPTKQWHYDFVPLPVWVGKPLRSLPIADGALPPITPPEVVEDDGRIFRFERRKIHSNKLPILSRLR